MISICHNKFLYIILLLLAHSIYLARQHYRRTVPSGEDDNRIIYRKLLCQMEMQHIMANNSRWYAITEILLKVALSNINQTKPLVDRNIYDGNRTYAYL
jgi:hypothetical protein